MSVNKAFQILDNGGSLAIVCPDGIKRELWGYNGNTGDVFISGWDGDAFMDCSTGEFKVTFE